MESIKPDSDAGLIGCLGGRRADGSAQPAIGPRRDSLLDALFGGIGKASRQDFLRVPEDRAASFANEREVLRETRAPVANSEMKPNSEPFVQHQPAVHRLRQQIGHVLARRSDRLDPDNYPFGKPAVWLEI